MTHTLPTNTNEAIVVFYNKILTTNGQRFTLLDLINYLTPFGYGTSNDTVARSLRKLRKSGKVNYSVVNHKQGIFVALPIETVSSEAVNG